MYKSKFGFTLAEVLITLGIIGVVAAITIPNLISSYKEKEIVAKLEQTYSVLSQALKMAEKDDEGSPMDWGLAFDNSSNDAIIVANKLKRYLKIDKDCGVEDSNSGCVLNTTYKLLNGSNTQNYATNSVYYKLFLQNGISIWWRTGTVESERIAFFVDINGMKPPNQWGKDLFCIAYSDITGLYAQGSPTGLYPYTDSCLGESPRGYGCAYYVLQYKNQRYLNK